MSFDASATITFGVTVEGELPWGDDLEQWWRDQNGFVDLPSPYGPDGNYAEGFNDESPEIVPFHEARRDWMKANPLPFEIHYSGSCEERTAVFAVPGSESVYHWDKPETFCSPPNGIPRGAEDMVAFFKKHSIEHSLPQWLVLVFYG